jgi:hypothetical protein
MLAQTQEWAEPELIDVAAVRLDVITYLRRRDAAALETVLAKRMLEQLVLSDPGRDHLFKLSVGRERPWLNQCRSNTSSTARWLTPGAGVQLPRWARLRPVRGLELAM